MLGASLLVNAYVIIKDGVPLAISVLNADQAEIVCGWKPNNSFDFVMHREAMRALVQLLTEALEKMDENLAAVEQQSSAAIS